MTPRLVSIRQIAGRLGWRPTTLYNRLRYGMTPENRRAYEAMRERLERERRELIERQRRPMFRLGGRNSENPQQNHR